MSNTPDFKTFERTVAVEFKKFVKDASVLANEHFKDSFRNQGFTDATFKKWEDRKVNPKGGKGKGKGRAILVKTGSLKRAIVVRAVGLNLIISNDRPYAEIHNNGGTIEQNYSRLESTRKPHVRRILVKGKKEDTLKRKIVRVGETNVKKHTVKRIINMPKRQFIGESKQLNDKLNKAFTSRMSAALSNLNITIKL